MITTGFHMLCCLCTWSLQVMMIHWIPVEKMTAMRYTKIIRDHPDLQILELYIQ